MDEFERYVRRVCKIAIAILSIYIASKVVYLLPETVQNKITNTTIHVTDSAIEEWNLLAGYLSNAPKYPETVQEFIVGIINAPIGIYQHMENIKKTQNTKTEELESVYETSVYETQEMTITEHTKASIEESIEESVEEESIQESSQHTMASPLLLPIQEQIVSDVVTLCEKGTISLEQMLDYTYLMEQFYVVDSSTSVSESVLNPTTLLSKDLSIRKENEEPQILIYHTHSQEAFADSIPGDVSQTIVGVGAYLTELLTNQYGYHVLHHTGVYDMENGKLDRSQAYNRALPAIEAILQQYPSIQVVIDLHRDGVSEQVHLVTDVNGKKVAKLMFFNGICRDITGELEQLSNPYREDNLAFSLQMGLHLKVAYPEVMRVLYLQKNRYNQHLASRCLLVEAGAQTNTVEEVMNSMELLAEILNSVLTR